MDKIIINELEVFANHGVYPEENALGQKFIVSAEIGCDICRASRSDSIDDSVSYAAICDQISRIMKKTTVKLIETAAQNICDELFFCFEKIKSISLTIEKPWAPIGEHLKSAAVKIYRERHKAYLSIGSNIGDRDGYLDFAKDELDKNKFCRVIAVSDYIETEPYGEVRQDKFKNACLEIETLLNPYELLEFIHDIELKAGRERKIHWGPRTLDIDILLYDEIIINDKDLIIPHRDMHRRLFVLEPLCAIAPYAYHPRLMCDMEELYKDLQGKEKIVG